MTLETTLAEMRKRAELSRDSSGRPTAGVNALLIDVPRLLAAVEAVLNHPDMTGDEYAQGYMQAIADVRQALADALNGDTDDD